MQTEQPPEVDPKTAELWRMALIEGERVPNVMRRFFRMVPSNPRCKACYSPYGGVGGRVFKVFGFGPSRKNPTICGFCVEQLPPGGMVVDVAILFADVRDSTALGEHLNPATFAATMNRFYNVATNVLIGQGALIDKLIGDEVMALFIPGVAGKDYKRKALEAAQELLAAVGNAAGKEPWLPVGVAVHAGEAYVGNVGSNVTDFTALGDTVNTAARLQSEAAAGQLVVSETLFEYAPLSAGEPREVHLRGRETPILVRVLDFTRETATIS